MKVYCWSDNRWLIAESESLRDAAIDLVRRAIWDSAEDDLGFFVEASERGIRSEFAQGWRTETIRAEIARVDRGELE